MEGLYFEVKPKREESQNTGSSETPDAKLTPNRCSCPSFALLASPKPRPRQTNPVCARRKTWVREMEHIGETEEAEDEETVQYPLKLSGFLPVHHLTTMAMLPWVVAEISRSAKMESGTRGQSARPGVGQTARHTFNQMVCLRVSASWVRCMSPLREGAVWDPLTHTVVFECRPHQVTKLIHNSREPGSFGFLVKKMPNCACYVFQSQDSTKLQLASEPRPRHLISSSSQAGAQHTGDLEELRSGVN